MLFVSGSGKIRIATIFVDSIGGLSSPISIYLVVAGVFGNNN
jgi:hypothetical protein